MSEEKPTFKVTDRRLFNADGTPREVEREEAPEPPPAAEPAAAPPAPEPPPRAAGTEAPPEARGAHEPARAREDDARAAPGGDPTPFANLVMFIASPAAAALGMTEHPGLAPGEVDLPLAKHCIDLLATVEQKTRGNLSMQEQQILQGLLAELRMQYVALAGTRPPTPPRGFTGGDITGGR
ncbi:MAG TPA: DUF1844 domain-containing protein [Pyrinomonadaceae bacterium]|jgi:hypothetical protein